MANNGEDSYETQLFMRVPEGLSYVNFDRLDTSKDVPILCSAPTPSTNNTLKCDIGNPLPFHSKARFRVFFQPRPSSEFKSNYEFYVEANSTNPEDVHRQADNLIRVSFPIRVQTDMKVFGVSDPQPVRHNATQWKKFTEKNMETEIGPEVTHIYEVKCEGPSDIEEAEVVILWPSYTVNGQHLMYLMEQPMVDGPAECEHVDDVNPLALQLSRKAKWQSQRTQQQYYEEQRVITAQGGELDTEEGVLRRTDGGYVSRGGGGLGGETTYSRSGSSSSHSSSRTVYSGSGQGGGQGSGTTTYYQGGSGQSGGGSYSAAGGSSSSRDTVYNRVSGDNRDDYYGSRGGGGTSVVSGSGHQYGRTTTTTTTTTNQQQHHRGTGSAIGAGAGAGVIESEEALLRREQAGVTSVSTGTGSQPNRAVFGSPVSGVLVHGAFDVSGADRDNVESSRQSSATRYGQSSRDNVFTSGAAVGRGTSQSSSTTYGGGASRQQHQYYGSGGGSSSTGHTSSASAGAGDIVGSGSYRESEEYTSRVYTRGGSGSSSSSDYDHFNQLGSGGSDVRSSSGGGSSGQVYGGGYQHGSIHSGLGSVGTGFHGQNTTSQHEYRREHSLGGGSGGASGGYTRTYNYSRSYSSQQQQEYDRQGRTGSGISSSGTPDEYEVSGMRTIRLILYKLVSLG